MTVFGTTASRLWWSAVTGWRVAELVQRARSAPPVAGHGEAFPVIRRLDRRISSRFQDAEGGMCVGRKCRKKVFNGVCKLLKGRWLGGEILCRKSLKIFAIYDVISRFFTKFAVPKTGL